MPGKVVMVCIRCKKVIQYAASGMCEACNVAVEQDQAFVNLMGLPKQTLFYGALDATRDDPRYDSYSKRDLAVMIFLGDDISDHLFNLDVQTCK